MKLADRQLHGLCSHAPKSLTRNNEKALTHKSLHNVCVDWKGWKNRLNAVLRYSVAVMMVIELSWQQFSFSTFSCIAVSTRNQLGSPKSDWAVFGVPSWIAVLFCDAQRDYFRLTQTTGHTIFSTTVLFTTDSECCQHLKISSTFQHSVPITMW